MKNRSGEASLLRDRSQELRTELARKIALFIGSAENRATAIPELTIPRRTAPTAPCSRTYEPSVTVIAQGESVWNLAGTFSSTMRRDSRLQRWEIRATGDAGYSDSSIAWRFTAGVG